MLKEVAEEEQKYIVSSSIVEYTDAGDADEIK
jgi:hypothetical protein